MRTGKPRRKFSTRRWVWQHNAFTTRPLSSSRHILGIACTGHGASLAYVGENGIVRSSVLDRWVGTKHMLMFSADEDRAIRNAETKVDAQIKSVLCYGFGRFPESCIFEQEILAWFQWLVRGLSVTANDIDLIVTSNSHFATCGVRLGLILDHWFPSARVFRGLEHHEVHQRQAFWQSGFEEAAVLTLDTCGESLARWGGRKLSGTISIMDNRGRSRVLKEMCFPDSSAGLIYDAVTRHVGFRQGDEGKTMGLAPYGSEELLRELRPHLRLQDDGGFRFIGYSKFQETLKAYVPEREADEELTQRHMNVAYAGQEILQDIVANAFGAALRMTGHENLVYAGGIALNSVANEHASRQSAPKRLYIPTNPGDTGHALGCVLFGAYELARRPPPDNELPEYLGPRYADHEMEIAARLSGYPLAEPEDAATILARCIAHGYIVARFDGSAEFGPRALGNRSILCDPRDPEMRDYLNYRVKHREGFRPFAPTVLEEHVPEWFEMEGRSSYMLRVVPVKQALRERVPAIVHVDGTARVQTVSRQENPGYWRLIRAFYEQTGVPLVLNTSFNVAGKPIVETPDDAANSFRSTEIDVLQLGPFIISKDPLQNYLDGARPGRARHDGIAR